MEVLHYGILIVAVIAMAGSLFFSEVMKLPPCVLCWYQRIAMYPIVALTMVGIIRNDRKLAINVLALAIPGLLISIYHNLLYWQILPESAAPCTLGISCTTKFFEWLGFITIPLMALTAFIIITAFALISLKQNNHETL
ncbi:MAG: disulfide bond formation protein B [Candidatus Buchananbacteria bacterium]|nr:disulfide bond formation protein B [Candidatus Buchananbacteria bacterium]